LKFNHIYRINPIFLLEPVAVHFISYSIILRSPLPGATPAKWWKYMFQILIVEDNAPFRQSLREMLCEQFSAMGIEEAVDGEDALDKIETLPPHLVFMDIKLPGQNGLEVTREIKARYPGIRVIILTSYDLPEYREAAQNYGADYFLSKGSSSREEIIAVVDSIFAELME
jgi:DNA-binding NarL/FixJ family response regulator